ncbi:Ig-like domain-containing protein [Streptomyces sp. NPDC002004]
MKPNDSGPGRVPGKAGSTASAPRTKLAAVGAAFAAVLLTMGAPPTATADPADAATPCGTHGVLSVSPPTCTYASTGTDTFTVPDGVSAVDVDLFGAEGGSAAGYVVPNPPATGAPGGLGGETHATLPVRPGQRLQITVGAAGIPGTSRHGEFARPGGFGHGSGGGGAHGGGGSGGGGSDVRAGTFGPSDRVLVAGGGGGAGNGGPLLHGGDGGGPEGEAGGQADGYDGAGVAGGGATQAAPGAGSGNSRLGGPGTAGGDIDPNTGQPNPGSGGPGGNGGAGGNGGGGGGGGYFGGAGGSGGGNPGNLPGAGGGGGSAFAAPTATDVSFAPGVNHGNGKATFRFRYDTSLALTADTSAPLFGHRVTLTADVAAVNPAADAPGGTVTFSEGSTPLATVPLTGGQARFSTSGLQPGSHTVTARYDGDPGHAPNAGIPSADITVGFSAPCLTTPRRTPLTVAAGESVCIAAGGRQQGQVTVRPGGALAVSGAEITGPVSADGALALSVCRSRLAGPFTVTGAGGYVLIGSDHDDTAACPGNTITGALTVEDGTGGIDVSGNTVTGPVRIDGNAGSGLPPGEAVPAFEANTVTGPVRCDGNQPTLKQAGNTVDGPRFGQCR